MTELLSRLGLEEKLLGQHDFEFTKNFSPDPRIREKRRVTLLFNLNLGQKTEFSQIFAILAKMSLEELTKIHNQLLYGGSYRIWDTDTYGSLAFCEEKVQKARILRTIYKNSDQEPLNIRIPSGHYYYEAILFLLVWNISLQEKEGRPQL